MSKLSKFLKSPGLFFRDALIRRHPIDFGNHVGQQDPEEGRVCVDPHSIEFPIDIVYTWVDGADSEWLSKKNHWQEAAGLTGLSENTGGEARFENHDELKYSLRSVAAYLPWVRNIYLVTCGQKPEWLDASHPKITVVDHADIMDEKWLPTFNSHVIEAHLHRIEGLAEHYIYFNDDVMAARPMEPKDFFLSNGARLVSLSGKLIPQGQVSQDDTPMDCASKNVRDLLETTYGGTIEHQVLHSYHCQTRTISKRCMELLEAHGKAFFGNRFRSHTDLNTATLLSHYVAWFESEAVFSPVACMYLNTHAASSRMGYEAMLSLQDKPGCPQTLCVNQVVSELTEAQRAEYRRLLSEFLEAYFPVPSPFEKTS